MRETYKVLYVFRVKHFNLGEITKLIFEININ